MTTETTLQDKRDRLKILFAIPCDGISGKYLDSMLLKMKAAIVCGHDIEVTHAPGQLSGASIDFMIFDDALL